MIPDAQGYGYKECCGHLYKHHVDGTLHQEG